MKRIILNVLLALMFASPAFAQNMMGDRGHNFLINYAEQLQLTESQKSQIIAIQVEQRNAMRSQRQEVRGSGREQGARQQWQRENRTAHHEQIMAVLTDAQRAQMKTLRKQRVEQNFEYRTMYHRQMIESANLSRSKARDVQKILDEYNKQMKAFQITRIESGEMGGSPEVQRAYRMAAQNQLKEILTVAEYEALGFGMQGNRGRQAGQGQRPGRTGQQRN